MMKTRISLFQTEDLVERCKNWNSVADTSGLFHKTMLHYVLPYYLSLHVLSRIFLTRNISRKGYSAPFKSNIIPSNNACASSLSAWGCLSCDCVCEMDWDWDDVSELGTSI